ncbi:MAG TPA: hypothetical protein PLI51_04190 [bacterium]|nr:hypothetical protein [bacterium]HPQ65909.1 hypothetical protein [bacterium]
MTSLPRSRNHAAVRTALRAGEGSLGPKTRAAILLASAFLIALQTLASLSPDSPLDRKRYGIRWTSGLKNPWVYAFGLRYWGVFPVYSTFVLAEEDCGRFGPEYARRVLREAGESLRMEYRHTARTGDSLKLYLPWLAGALFRQPVSPAAVGESLKLFAAAAFLLSLYCLLYQFSAIDRPILGALTAVFIASSEFQAVEIARGNVFSYPITTAVFAIALLAPLAFNLARRTGALLIRLALLAGIIALAGNIRPTAAALLPAPVLVLLLYRPLPPLRRAAAAAAFLLLAAGWHLGIRAYFDHKWEEAESFVREHGGTPYCGHRIHNHGFWHPIWCGLGDFDITHGYAWRDWEAWAYAKKIMRARGIELKNLEPAAEGNLRDAGAYFKIDTHPGYESILRDKVLADIAADPFWYGGILGRRLHKIVAEWQDVRLNLVGWAPALPSSFWFYLPVCVLLLFLGMGGELKLILTASFTGLPALAVTTITNAQYYFIGHLVCAAVAAACLINAGLAACRKTAKPRAPGADGSAETRGRGGRR